MFVSKGCLTINEADIDPASQGDILHPIIEKKRVTSEGSNALERCSHAVFVDEDGHITERTSQHERFIACKSAVEEESAAIMDNTCFMFVHAQPFALEPPKKGRLFRFVATREDRDFAASVLKCSSKLFHNGCFTSAAYGEVSNGDHEATGTVGLEKAAAKKPESGLDKHAKKPA
jgi:hypothetical protein